jgi:hypothetical protein
MMPSRVLVNAGEHSELALDRLALHTGRLPGGDVGGDVRDGDLGHTTSPEPGAKVREEAPVPLCVRRPPGRGASRPPGIGRVTEAQARVDGDSFAASTTRVLFGEGGAGGADAAVDLAPSLAA